MRTCRKCGEEKDLDGFYNNKNKPNGKETWCKSCSHTNTTKWRNINRERKNELERNRRKSNPVARNNARFKHLYNITVDDYQKMFERQLGRCAICRGIETSLHQNGQIKSLSVDHDHNTNKIRGLFCDRCNRGIGFLKDDPEILRAAITYLESKE